MNNFVKKVTIYPFYDEFVPMIKYLNVLNSNYEVCHVVSPMGFGINGKDAGEAYKKGKIGFIVTSNLDEALLDSDVLLITDEKRSALMYSDIIKQAEKAIAMKKEVICALKLSDNDILELKELSQKNNVLFTYLNDSDCFKDYENIDDQNVKIKRINAPVIFIGEVMSGFGAFDMLLKTTIYLQKQGYNVLGIGNPRYSGLFNINIIPDFIYQTNIKEESKIHSFNAYVHELEKEKNPNVIVIQLPGGLMKYNDMITNGFGIYPFIISQAVRGDYLIYCSQFDNVETRMFKMLSDTFQFRFGCEINAVNMTNKGFDPMSIMEQDENISFVWHDQTFADGTLSKYKDSIIPVYNCENNNSCIKMLNEMIDTLSGYGQALNIV